MPSAIGEPNAENIGSAVHKRTESEITDFPNTGNSAITRLGVIVMSGRAFAPLKKGVNVERPQAKEPASTSSVAADPVSLEEKIRARAYEIYLERGSQDGSSLDDWLSAENQIHGSQPKQG